MSFDIVLPTTSAGFALQRHDGETSLSEAEAAGEYLTNQYPVPGFSGVLLDLRASRPQFSPADLIGVIEQYYPRLPAGFPLAYVLHERNHEIEQMIVQTLAFNHGHVVRFFTEVESAQVWLDRQISQT